MLVNIGREKMSSDSPVLEARNLSKNFISGRGLFRRGKRIVRAVDDLDLLINKKESFGLVGESGCGKTTVARLLMLLTEPTKGTIKFNNTDLLKLNPGELRRIRTQMQMIFQDPYSFLNPRKTIRQILRKPYKLHSDFSEHEIQEKIEALVEDVGLKPPDLFLNRYPHELSGGQRQRVGIARAISLNPKFVIADEPVSALDVSVRAQILNLLIKLQSDHDLTYLFISHDLSVVRSLCDRVGVMYLGRLVEIGPNNEIFPNPLHPYTRALLGSTPVPDPKVMSGREYIVLGGEVPNAISPPSGCYFHPRCPNRGIGCDSDQPKLQELRPNHFVACHYAEIS